MTAPESVTATKDDFRSIPWEAALQEAQEATCFAYSTLASRRAREAETSGDQKAVAVFTFLARVTSLSLNPTDAATPFRHRASGPGWRTVAIEDLTPTDLELLRNLASDVTDHELKARFTDILWTATRDYPSAVKAVDAYLESAARLFDPERWPNTFHRIERAIGLAMSINGEPLKRAIAFVEAQLEGFSASEPSYFPAKLMTLLLDRRLGKAVEYAALATSHAAAGETLSQWDTAREYWSLAAQWHRMNKDKAAAEEASKRAAETYVHEARSRLNGSSGYSVAATFLRNAIEAFRRLGGHRERVSELQKEMLEYQRRSVDNLQTVSGEVDIADMVGAARSRVRGKTLPDAVLSLATITMPIGVERLRQQVEESAKTYVFKSLFPTVLLNEEGKVVAQRDALRPSAGAEGEEAMRCAMHAEMRWHRQVLVAGIVEPARDEIWTSHPVDAGDLIPFLRDNPFVPPGREVLFAKGLAAGFTGDFIVSLHLLAPQFEHSIRILLMRLGAQTSTLSAEGIQEEKNLNTLLQTPEAAKLFGKDVLFDLEGLLVNRWGANIRNKVAHGLMNAWDCNSYESCYLWWTCLRLICAPHLLAMNAPGEEEATSDLGADNVEIEAADETPPTEDEVPDA